MSLLKEDILAEVEILKSSEIIIVEGKKDKASLERIGITNVVCLRGSIFEFCERLAKKYGEAVILTDLDFEGRKLYSNLKEDLERFHIKISNRFRNFLLRKTEIRHIEGLNSYLANLN